MLCLSNTSWGDQGGPSLLGTTNQATSPMTEAASSREVPGLHGPDPNVCTIRCFARSRRTASSGMCAAKRSVDGLWMVPLRPGEHHLLIVSPAPPFARVREPIRTQPAAACRDHEPPTFQMRSAYSRTARSLEKRAMPATLRMARAPHNDGSAQVRSISSCAALKAAKSASTR
jgi:hypothetical protein